MFLGLFYHKYREGINEVIVGTAQNYSESWKPVKQFNHTNIALVPKIQSHENILPIIGL